MKLRDPRLWLLLSLCLGLVGIVPFFLHLYGDQARHVARQNSVALAVAYQASIDRHRLDAETRFKNQIMRAEVLDLLAQANRATVDELPAIRGRLYRTLRPEYRDMVASGLDPLHFHFPDGRSLLRFHAPHHVDDPSLFDIRPAIRIANTELRPVFGFEGGRISPGFRYVFPIIRSGLHLGSVELSLTFTAIQRNLIGLLPGGDYALLLHRDLVEMVFAEERGNFVAANLHADYFKKDPAICELSRAFGESEHVRLLNARLRQDAAVQAKLSAGKSFSVPLLHAGRGYIASFHAIYDLDERHAAYVVGYAAAPLLIEVRNALLWQAFLVATLLLLLTGSGLLLLRNQQRLRAEKSRLQAITASVGEGLYMVDELGNTVMVNQTACDLTGFSEKELLGNNIHKLIHCHAGNNFMPADDCPIVKATKTGAVFRGEEMFATKSGHVFPVEVTSRPLFVRGGFAGAVTLFRNISVRKRQEVKLRRLANTDALTGIANRRHFMEQFDEELERVRRYGGPLTLLILDLDHFKRVNDTYGHAVGDAVLCHCVALIQKRQRRADIFGRLGGEEFGLLLPQTDLAGAYEFATSLRRQLAASPCPGPHGPINLTVSIGIAAYDKGSDGGLAGRDEGDDAESILARADRALYRAKAEGRNRVVVEGHSGLVISHQ